MLLYFNFPRQLVFFLNASFQSHEYKMIYLNSMHIFIPYKLQNNLHNQQGITKKTPHLLMESTKKTFTEISPTVNTLYYSKYGRIFNTPPQEASWVLYLWYFNPSLVLFHKTSKTANFPAQSSKIGSTREGRQDHLELLPEQDRSIRCQLPIWIDKHDAEIFKALVKWISSQRLGEHVRWIFRPFNNEQ